MCRRWRSAPQSSHNCCREDDCLADLTTPISYGQDTEWPSTGPKASSSKAAADRFPPAQSRRDKTCCPAWNPAPSAQCEWSSSGPLTEQKQGRDPAGELRRRAAPGQVDAPRRVGRPGAHGSAGAWCGAVRKGGLLANRPPSGRRSTRPSRLPSSQYGKHTRSATRAPSPAAG